MKSNESAIRKVFTYFVLSIPILFAFAANTTGYFPGRSLNPGTIRGLIMTLFIVLFLLKYRPKDHVNSIIFFYVFYYFFLCFFSSNYSESFYGFFRFFISILMFPVGFVFIRNYNYFQNLNKSLFIALCIFIINLVISNLFNLGTSDYLEDSVYFGAGRVNITKTMLIVVFGVINLLPVLSARQKKYFIATILIAIFIAIIGIKRSVLLSLGVGFLFYLRYNKLRNGLFKILLPIIVALLVTYFFFPQAFEVIQERFEAREDRIGLNQDVVESEARFGETSLVINAWVDGGVIHKLFGSELFNDRSFFHSKRMLHTDYMVILNGSGIIGIILWFGILLSIFKVGKKYLKYFDKDIRFPFLRSTFYALLASQLFMSISGTIQGIDIRSYIFLYLGAIVGTMRGEYLRKRIIQKNHFT